MSPLLPPLVCVSFAASVVVFVAGAVRFALVVIGFDVFCFIDGELANAAAAVDEPDKDSDEAVDIVGAGRANLTLTPLPPMPTTLLLLLIVVVMMVLLLLLLLDCSLPALAALDVGNGDMIKPVAAEATALECRSAEDKDDDDEGGVWPVKQSSLLVLVE